MAHSVRAVALTLLLSLYGMPATTALGQCVGPGPGGMIPSMNAAEGTWPTQLPEAPAQSAQWIDVPPGATHLSGVLIYDLFHTALGEVQIVLQSPSGVSYNIFQPVDDANTNECRDDFSGSIEFVDAQRYDPCGTGLGVWRVRCGLGPFLGTAAQMFGNWPDGASGIHNVRLEEIPIETGPWTLTVYDWSPPSESGNFGSWDLCFGPPSVPIPGYAPHQRVRMQSGQSFPTPGDAGSWPTRVPSGALVSNAFVSVPSGASRLLGVRLVGLNHDVTSQCQIVLSVPTGERINLFQAFNGSAIVGTTSRFAGDYTFVDPIVGRDECGNLAWDFGSVNFGVEVPGTYRQHFGNWPNGASNIRNRALSSMPAVSGVYTLSILDWQPQQNSGHLAAWELCFDHVSGPVTYCPQPVVGSTFGCVGTIAASGSPDVQHAGSCVISVSGIDGARAAVLFYGRSGRFGQPWCGSSPNYLCVRQPLARLVQASSGGTLGSCNGTLQLDWNARMSSVGAPLGEPFRAGESVHVQAWFRDPPACKQSRLTDALELTYTP
ncbi:MAG: hypothetical protein FJ298_12075 [Planctomycetes bacterium]|nr:hypothetical protein [Planctomycetota bacterium]